LASFRQKDVFLTTEGDAWFARNKKNIQRVLEGRSDPVVAAIETLSIRPREVLEIGCADGWRLNQLVSKYRAGGTGVDPSLEAVHEGQAKYRDLDLSQATADFLPFADSRFDLVIYGFCLYLCDRRDLFRIVAEGDRVLMDGGHLVIYDFLVNEPHRRHYHHDTRVLSYKMDYTELFRANPVYRAISTQIVGAESGKEQIEDERIAVTILKKDVDKGFPLRTVTP
jgi:ubiquinone/menaquinone biosynthesis C-methylase UbiE